LINTIINICFDSIGSEFTLGEPVDVLIGLKNIAQQSEESTGSVFNVQYARGYLLSAEGALYQNLTGLAYNVTIGPSQSTTILYSFVASPQLEGREYNIAVEVFYVSGTKDAFGTIAYNDTLSFVQKEESLFTVGSIVQLAMVAGMIGLVLFGLLQVFSGRTKKRGSSTTTSTGDQVSADKIVTVGKEQVNTDFIPASHKKLVDKLQKKKKSE
jgi:hypothetical protein